MTRGDVLQEFHPDAFHSIVVACKKECSCQCSLFSLLPFTFAYLTFLSQFLSFLPEARRPSCTSFFNSFSASASSFFATKYSIASMLAH
jgi:hypothetical protein